MTKHRNHNRLGAKLPAGTTRAASMLLAATRASARKSAMAMFARAIALW